MRKKAFWEYQWKEIRIAVLVLGIALVCGVLSMLAVSEEIFFYDYDVASTSLLYLGNVARGGKIFSYAAWCMGEYLPFSFLECMAIPEKWSYSAVCPTPGGELGGGLI